MLNEECAIILKEIISKNYENVRLDSIYADENEFYYEFKADDQVSEKDFENLER